MIHKPGDRPPVYPEIRQAPDCFAIADQWLRPPGLDFQAGTSGTVDQAAGRLWVIPFTNRLPLRVKALGTYTPTDGALGTFIRCLIYEMTPAGHPGRVRAQTDDIDQGSSVGSKSESLMVELEPRTWGLGVVTSTGNPATITGLDKNDLRRLGTTAINDSAADCHFRYSVTYTGAGEDLSYPESPALRTQDPPLVAVRAEIINR